MNVEYIVNSTNTAAVRKGTVVGLFITNPSEGEFHLNVRTENLSDVPPNMAFETATTLEGIQAKAAALLAELSA